MLDSCFPPLSRGVGCICPRQHWADATNPEVYLNLGTIDQPLQILLAVVL